MGCQYRAAFGSSTCASSLAARNTRLSSSFLRARAVIRASTQAQWSGLLSTCISMSSVVGGRGISTGRTTAGECRGTSMTRTAVPARSAAARSACAARRQAVEHQILRRPRRGLSPASGVLIGRPQRGHKGPASLASISSILKRHDEMLPSRDLCARGVIFGERVELPTLSVDELTRGRRDGSR
jgi:hypothetical protein